MPVKGLFDIILSGMGKNARFRDAFLAACAAVQSVERHGPAAVYANWKEGGE